MTQPIGSGAPAPVSGVTGGPGLPQGVASVDGGTGNVIISPPSNTIEQKKTNVPQSLLVYEYFGSNTDFVRIGLQTQTNGPEFIGVTVAPAGVIRDLTIGTTGNLLLAPGGGLAWRVLATALAPVTNMTHNVGTGAAFLNQLFTDSLSLNGLVGVTIFAGNTVPGVGIGANGSYYFRSDTPATALQRIYVKSAGVWVGIV